jgi:hypothetical protein
MSVQTIDKFMSKVETTDGEIYSIYQRQYNTSPPFSYAKLILDVDSYSEIEKDDYLYSNSTTCKTIAFNRENELFAVYCGKNSGTILPTMSPPVYIDTELLQVGKVNMSDGAEYIIKEPFRKYQTNANIYGFGIGWGVYTDSSNKMMISVCDFRDSQYCWVNEAYFDIWYV